MKTLKTLPFYLLLIMTFGVAGLEKLFAFTVPTWFLSQFQGSLLDLFPGALVASFVLIAGLELATFSLLTVGLIRKSPQQLGYGIILAQITFIALGFGQRLTHKHDSAGALFFFAALTFLAGHFALAEDRK